MAETNQGLQPGLTTQYNNDGRDNHDLQQLLEQASYYAINMDQQVDRDTTDHFSTGADAIVYRGTHRPEGTFVAIKMFRFGHKSDISVLKNMLREVHVWSKLKHPNVLPLLGIATKFDNTISIISKWMSRGNAHEYVQDFEVDPRPLLLGIARGLNYLHNRISNPVYHGDLKGFNVLISDEGHALLTDFGLSYLVNSSFSMTSRERHGGTLRWMAPEFLDESNITMSSAGDVWSFGMTALELFTRKIPFHDIHGRTGVIARILQRRLPCRPSDDSTQSRMTDEWWDLCYLCWNAAPASRPSMSKIVEMIAQTTSESVDSTLGIPVQPTTQSPLAKIIQQATQFDVKVLEEIEGHLGGPILRGRCATVFRGVTLPTGINVAIKTFRASPPGQDWAIRRVLYEVDTWSKLSHENILSLLGITFKFDFTVSLVFPWVERGNVHDYVQDNVVDPRPLLADIANGLQYLHNHYPPIYHGDLKGSNVLVSNDGRALLTDFGLPFLVDLAFSIGTNATSKSSMNWTAPEGFDQWGLTAEVDIWAFGMTALELFTRQQPFHDIELCSKVLSRITQGPAPPRPSNDSTCFRLTDSWWRICCSCWQHEPSSRPSILDIVSQIKQIPPNDTISVQNLPATSGPFSPPGPNFMSDCVILHELLSSGDRKLVPVHISDRMQSGFAILARAVEGSVKDAEQGVLLVKSMLKTESETELQRLTINFQHLCKTSHGNLRDARKGLEAVLSQCKNMTWELVHHAKDDGGIRAWFNGKAKARQDAMMYLQRVTDTLTAAVESMNSIIDWWTMLLKAAGILATAAARVRNITGFQSSARVGLGQVTGGLELYQEAMREPMHSLRTKFKALF